MNYEGFLNDKKKESFYLFFQHLFSYCLNTGNLLEC